MDISESVLARIRARPRCRGYRAAIKQGRPSFYEAAVQNDLHVQRDSCGGDFGFITPRRGGPLAWKMVISFLPERCARDWRDFGMFVSIRANLRAASAARTSLNRAHATGVARRRGDGIERCGAVVARVGIISGVWRVDDPLHVPYDIVGFGLGAASWRCSRSWAAELYTKAADVGADLVGTVEAGIPEDDPRNRR